MNDREVAEYLLANPDFFAEHAEMLATIRLANPHGKAAVSLQERQMDMLRDKNKHLERRLAELLRYGHENDSIAAKFGRWTTRVMAERDPHALPRTISNGLRDVFDVPQAALRVWDVAEPYAHADFARHVGEEVRIFANSLATPYCGANTGFEAAQWLAPAGSAVPEEGQPAGESAAGSTGSIPPLGPRGPGGPREPHTLRLAAVGSPHPPRLHRGMA